MSLVPDMSNEYFDFESKWGKIKAPLQLPYPPNTLSVVMIVKNEIKNIRTAIETIHPIADEIIINDTGSTDGTQDILEELRREFNIKWIQTSWQNDFSLARNQSIEQATSSWLIWLDADDRIPTNEIETFKKLKTAPLDRVFGFQIINTQAGQPIGTRFMQIRMFPNHPSLRFERKIHEQIVFNAARLGLHCMYLETTIWHTGYELQEKKKEKALRNIQLSELSSELIGKDPTFTACLGDSYYILEQWQKGIDLYQQAYTVPHLKKINKDIYQLLPQHIGLGYFHLQNYNESLKWLKLAQAENSNSLESFYYEAEIYRLQKQYEKAISIYQQILEMPLVYSSIGNQYDSIRIYTFHTLGSLYLTQGDYNNSIITYVKMHQFYPKIVESWQNLAIAFRNKRNYIQCLQAWENCLKLAAGRVAHIYELALEDALVAGNSEKLSQWLEEAKTYFPQTNWSKFHLHSNTLNFSQGLSLCMIVKNEEENIRLCLQSVKTICQQIIVVDTGSTDKTVEIAKSEGAEIFHFEWCDDFSAARNYSLEQARYPWILWLDADDRVPQKSLPEIELTVKANSQKAYGFVITSTSDNGQTQSSFYQIRLFPNDPSIRFTSPIHEQVLPSIEKKQLPIHYTPIEIIHTGYFNPEIAKTKQIRNKKLLSKQIVSGHNITPVTLYTLAHAHFDLGEFQESIHYFLAAVELAEKSSTDPHILQIGPVKTAAALASIGKLDQAQGALSIALKQNSIHPEAYLVKAQIESALNNVEEAKFWFEKILTLEEKVFFIPVNYHLLKIKACEFLGQYWNSKGHQNLAVDILKKGLSLKERKSIGEGWLQQVYHHYSLI